MLTVIQTARLVPWVIMGLILLGGLLHFFGPAELETGELIVIGALIIGLIWFQSTWRMNSKRRFRRPGGSCYGHRHEPKAGDSIICRGCLFYRCRISESHIPEDNARTAPAAVNQGFVSLPWGYWRCGGTQWKLN